jgi:hypothetical protein
VLREADPLLLLLRLRLELGLRAAGFRAGDLRAFPELLAREDDERLDAAVLERVPLLLAFALGFAFAFGFDEPVLCPLLEALVVAILSSPFENVRAVTK